MPNRGKSLIGVVRARPLRFWVLAAGWLLATIILFVAAYRLRYVLTVDDGIAYIRIAENYQAGRLGDALNAFWSPMISWSMLPFMAAGASSQQAFMFANAAWSSIGIGAGVLFTWRWGRRSFVGSAIVGVVLFVLYAADLPMYTPDLLVITWTILFAWVLTEANDRLGSESRGRRIGAGVALGVVLALGYFIKAYAVPVFIVVGLGWLVVRYVAIRRANPRFERAPIIRRQLWAPVAAIAVFLILIAPFVIGISVKYGMPTFGSSAAVNTQDKLGPAAATTTAPSLSLEAPPNAYAIYFAYDPTVELTDGHAKSGSTPHRGLISGLVYYAHQRVAALPFYLGNIAQTSPFAMIIAVMVVLLLIFGRLDPRKHRAAVIATAVLVVYFLGYAAITTQATGGGRLRYHWPLLALSAIVASLLWPAVWERTRGQILQRIVVIILILLTPIAAVRQLGLNQPFPFSTSASTASIAYIVHPAVESNPEILADRMLATGVIKPGDRLVAGSGHYIKTLTYAFFLRAQLYGRQRANDYTDPRFQQVMRDKKIDYYFLYQPAAAKIADVSSWGSIKKSYVLPYSCGSVAGVPSTECRLSIVSVNP